MPTEVQPAVASSAAEAGAVCFPVHAVTPNWLYNLRVLWGGRRGLLRATGVAFIASLIVSLVIPKMYVSRARIMPPEASNSNTALFAALTGRALGSDALGGLAASLIGGRNSGALFADLLRSGSVTDALIERFQLRSVYHKRYRVDAAKVLARRTEIVLDKKSGVLTISVKDGDPKRARDIAQAYLDQLDVVVNRTGTSSAHQERVFIEKRLQQVKGDLKQAEEAMSEFSSTHSAIDLKEQAQATVESEAKVQGELIVAEGELESLRQIYGESNVRVRETQARIAALKRELARMGGSAAPLAEAGNRTTETSTAENAVPYLPLRQVPRLAVPYADLYRALHVHETVYDLLTQQYEIARIEEAKDVPQVSIIDAPGIPEKKSFPPRTLLTLGLTLLATILYSVGMLCRHYWQYMDAADPRKAFGLEVFTTIGSMRLQWRRWRPAS
jgi:capsule polysaccharide export protein KpsE/RkpR